MCTERTKVCFKCGVEKPLSEFYRHPQMADGHLNKCKDCTRKDTTERRVNHPDLDLETRLKACVSNPTKKNAYMALDAAIRSGKITRPNVCSGCGCTDDEHRIEAHHYDYSKPLDVIWLCTPCHRRMDAQRRIREGKTPYGIKTGHKNTETTGA